MKLPPSISHGRSGAYEILPRKLKKFSGSVRCIPVISAAPYSALTSVCRGPPCDTMRQKYAGVAVELCRCAQRIGPRCEYTSEGATAIWIQRLSCAFAAVGMCWDSRCPRAPLYSCFTGLNAEVVGPVESGAYAEEAAGNVVLHLEIVPRTDDLAQQVGIQIVNDVGRRT